MSCRKSQFKINKSIVFDFSKTMLLFSFTEYRSIRLRLAIFKCTLYSLPIFCIPKRLAAGFSPVSTKNIFTFLVCFSRNTVPIGFCCGGFSSTAGYVPGNEAHLLALMSDFCSLSVVPCQKILFVFIQTTRKILRLFLSQAFRLRFKA